MPDYELQPEHGKLARSDLPAPLKAAIDAARSAQLEGPSWDQRDKHRALPLADGMVFLPDEREAASGSFLYIGGIVLAILGVVFTHMAWTDRKAEDWMTVAGPLFLIVGAYGWWAGRKKNAEAAGKPRLSGAYLVEDVLMTYREDTGCRVFPARSIVDVLWEVGGGDNRLRLSIVYRDAHGETHRSELSQRNMETSLKAWLAQQRGESSTAQVTSPGEGPRGSPMDRRDGAARPAGREAESPRTGRTLRR